jgi:hypothetical protein
MAGKPPEGIAGSCRAVPWKGALRADRDRASGEGSGKG